MGWFERALGGAFAAAEAVVPDWLRPGISAGELIAISGADPAPAARLGLAKLVEAIEADCELSLFGRLSVRWDILRLLRNAQRIEDAHAAEPALGRAPVEAPVFILGLPRSGTTFLHTLMAEDAENLVPRNWQTIYPGPRPTGFAAEADARARAVDRQLRVFEAFANGFSQLHPIGADSPQECSEINAHVFQSLRFDTTFRVPGYLAWLEAHGHERAFAFHKRFLQFLQAGRPGRWVLKCPDHTFSMDAILKIYPDARFVIVHRDPVAVLGSVARLTEVLRRPFLKNIDAEEIAGQVAARWIEGANLLLAFDERADVAADRKLHIHYDDLTNAPLAAVAQIYAQFDMELGDDALAAMSGRIAARERGGYGRHAPYSLDAFGQSAGAITAQFAPYVSQYCRGST
jgi:hypothetical protein